PPPPPTSPLFPYTTLFRSPIAVVLIAAAAVFGGATPTDRRAAHGGPLSVLIPIVTALGSAAVILGLDDRLGGTVEAAMHGAVSIDRKGTRLNSSHEWISYA